MEKGIMDFKNFIALYKSGKFDSLIVNIFFILKRIIQVNLFLYVLVGVSILLFFTNAINYNEEGILYFTIVIINYGAFYYTLFVSFPAILFLLLLYYSEKRVRSIKTSIKCHLILIGLSVFILLIYIIVSFVVISNLH
jgi:hypothetical protein